MSKPKEDSPKEKKEILTHWEIGPEKEKNSPKYEEVGLREVGNDQDSPELGKVSRKHGEDSSNLCEDQSPKQEVKSAEEDQAEDEKPKGKKYDVISGPETENAKASVYPEEEEGSYLSLANSEEEKQDKKVHRRNKSGGSKSRQSSIERSINYTKRRTILGLKMNCCVIL